MNKDVEKQNKNETTKPEKKKSLLSGLIEVEQDTPKKEKKPEPSKKQVEKKVEKKEEKLSEDEQLLVNTGEGVNLIPKKSKAEISKEKKKFSFSVTSLVSLAILVILSFAIVLFNIISKQQLNAAEESLYKKELQMETYEEKMIANEEILERIDLYRYLQKGVFSPKEILEYIMAIVNSSGHITIRSFDLGNNLSFEMSGSTSSLEVVSKLWYLLGIDKNIDTVNLQSVGKTEDGANFSFEGQLNADNFISE